MSNKSSVNLHLNPFRDLMIFIRRISCDAPVEEVINEKLIRRRNNVIPNVRRQDGRIPTMHTVRYMSTYTRIFMHMYTRTHT